MPNTKSHTFCCLSNVLALFLYLGLINQAQAEYPIFDVHIHYSHDVWEAIPPADAVKRLRQAGIRRALVSSSSDKGTQMIFEADPELIVPSLRPYRKREDVDGWVDDLTVIPYLEDRLARFSYVAIGEFHVNGVEADFPVVKRLVELAREHELVLHAHADADAIRRLFAQYPDARILWAHAGFEYASTVEEMMDTYPRLWADLSFRREIYLNGRFLQTWRELLIKHADRFMLGVDTYTPQRWLEIRAIIERYQDFLKALPPDVAEKIAYKNAESLLGSAFEAKTVSSNLEEP